MKALVADRALSAMVGQLDAGQQHFVEAENASNAKAGEDEAIVLLKVK